MRIILLLLFFISKLSFGNQPYFLCGPDEDGCPEENNAICFCVPYDELTATQPYCLDFETIACIPLEKSPQCPSHNVFKNQSACLATAFQSEPNPPCPLTSDEFCRAHHIPRCLQDGGLASCH